MDKLTNRLELIRKMMRDCTSSNFYRLHCELEYNQMYSLYMGGPRPDTKYEARIHNELVELKIKITEKIKLLVLQSDDLLKREVIKELSSNLKIWNEDDLELIYHKYFCLIERSLKNE